MKYIRIIIGGAIMLLSFLLGEITGLLTTLIVFIIIDYITGVGKSIYISHKSSDPSVGLDSKIGFKGILKKIGIITIVVVTNLIEVNLMQYIPNISIPIREIVIVFFISNEGLSILENVVLMGVPIPDTIKNVLVQFKNKDSTAKKKEEFNGAKINTSY